MGVLLADVMTMADRFCGIFAGSNGDFERFAGSIGTPWAYKVVPPAVVTLIPTGGGGWQRGLNDDLELALA